MEMRFFIPGKMIPGTSPVKRLNRQPLGAQFGCHALLLQYKEIGWQALIAIRVSSQYFGVASHPEPVEGWSANVKQHPSTSSGYFASNS